MHLEARELAFLRTMAQHCRETMMAGYKACERLDKLLADMGIKTYDEINGGPTYGLFEVL
jgi:hypothetical protein